MIKLLESIVSDNKPFLLISITSLIIGLLPFIYSIFLTVKYKKEEAKFKHFSVLYTSIMLSLLGVGSLFGIVSILISLGTIEITTTVVAYIFPVFSIVCSALSYISLFTVAHYLFFATTDKGIDYFGESIKIENINSILVDENEGFCYIVYFEGSRKVKKLKISNKFKKIIDNIDEIAKTLNLKAQKTNVKENYTNIYKSRRSVDISGDAKSSNKEKTKSTKKESIDLSDE